MKRCLLITLLLIYPASGSIAAKKCIQISSSFTGTPVLSSATWEYTSNGITVRGLAACASHSGIPSSKATSITGVGQGTNCWLRLTYPVAAPHWVVFGSITGVSEPALTDIQKCQKYCSAVPVNSSYIYTHWSDSMGVLMYNASDYLQ